MLVLHFLGNYFLGLKGFFSLGWLEIIKVVAFYKRTIFVKMLVNQLALLF